MRSFRSRLAKIETARRHRTPYVVMVPNDTWAHGEAQAQSVIEAALRQDGERYGHRRPVVLGVMECGSVEEWAAAARYGFELAPHESVNRRQPDSPTMT